MRYPITISAFLLAVAQPGAAQSFSVKELGRPRPFEIALGLSFGSVERPLAGYNLGAPIFLKDQNGAAVDARFHLPEHFFLTVGAKAYADVSVLSGGLGVALTAGDGRFTLAFEEAYVNVSSVDEYWQARLIAGYEHNFEVGLRLGFSIHHIVSSNDFFLNKEDVTAPVFTLGYRLHNGHTLDLSLSSNDYILGSPDSGRALSFGYKIAF
jgi:hypothetical protein